MKTPVSESRSSLQQSCFPVNFAKFLRNVFFFNTPVRPFQEPMVFNKKRVPNNFAWFIEKLIFINKIAGHWRY